MIRAESLIKWDGTSYTNLTSSTYADAPFTFISSSGDCFYIGSPNRFTGVITTLTTNGSYTSVAPEYYNGLIWKNLNVIESYGWDNSRYQRWVLPDDWEDFGFTASLPYSTTATLPDNVERYWVRYSASAVTTPAVISKFRIIPYALYATADDVANLLQTDLFTDRTAPTKQSVEDMIRRMEDQIDWRTKNSWKFHVEKEELSDYKRHGMALRYRNAYDVYTAEMWNGNQWQTLIEGRDQDYFYERGRGMLFFTRLFILPALYSPVGRYSSWWGYGEYKFNIKIHYSYGQEWDTSPTSYLVRDITTKLVAIDLLTKTDFTIMTVSGADNVDLKEKITFWRDDIEQRLDELSSFYTY